MIRVLKEPKEIKETLVLLVRKVKWVLKAIWVHKETKELKVKWVLKVHKETKELKVKWVLKVRKVCKEPKV